MRKSSKKKPDESYQELLETIKQLVKTSSLFAEKQLAQIRPTIEQIIEKKEKDQPRIEHTLDTLLTIAYLGNSRKEFEELVTYYESVNPEAAKSYREYYREIVEDN